MCDRIDGPLAFPVDFPTLVQAVTGAWLRRLEGRRNECVSTWTIDSNPNKHTNQKPDARAHIHVGIWDAHPHNGAIIAQAAKCLRVAATAASPIHLPPKARSPALYLSQGEYWTR